MPWIMEKGFGPASMLPLFADMDMALETSMSVHNIVLYEDFVDPMILSVLEAQQKKGAARSPDVQLALAEDISLASQNQAAVYLNNTSASDTETRFPHLAHDTPHLPSSAGDETGLTNNSDQQDSRVDTSSTADTDMHIARRASQALQSVLGMTPPEDDGFVHHLLPFQVPPCPDSPEVQPDQQISAAQGDSPSPPSPPAAAQNGESGALKTRYVTVAPDKVATVPDLKMPARTETPKKWEPAPFDAFWSSKTVHSKAATTSSKGPRYGPGNGEHSKQTDKKGKVGRAYNAVRNAPKAPQSSTHASGRKKKQQSIEKTSTKGAWPRGGLGTPADKPTATAVHRDATGLSSSSSSHGWTREETGHRHFIDPLAPWNHGVAVFPAHLTSTGPVVTLEQSNRYVNAWLDKHIKAMAGMSMEISFADYQRYMLTSNSAKDSLGFDPERWSRTIVPEYWKPLNVGQESPAMFWQKYMASDAPGPVCEGDLDGALPWWIRDPTHLGVFHAPEVFDVDAGIDPDEDAAQREARRSDQGSNYFAARWRKTHQKTTTRRGDSAASAPIDIVAQQPTGIRPRIPLLIRHAQREDMLNISKILNHYIANTTAVLSNSEYTEEDMKDRWRTCQKHNLPILVACQPNFTTGRDALRPQRRSVFVPESVIGFAIATERHLHGSLSIENKEAQVFTDPAYTNLGVATCLLDKMLKAINPAYTEKTICETDVQSPGLASSPSTPIKNVFVELLRAADQKDGTQRIHNWLCTRLDMDHCGKTSSFAIKDEKTIDMHTFKYSFARR